MGYTVTGNDVTNFVKEQSVQAADYADKTYDQAVVFLNTLTELADWQPTVTTPPIDIDTTVNPFSPAKPEVTSSDLAVDVSEFTEVYTPGTVTLDSVSEDIETAPYIEVTSLGSAPAYTLTPPSFETVSIEDGPSFTNPFDGTITIPTFDVETPTLSIPEIPDITYPADPGEIGDLEDIDTPTMRDLNVPDIPEVEVSIPEAPSITIGEFNEAAPEMTLSPPSNTFLYSEPGHDSLRGDIIDAIDSVEEYSADAEDATWERARARLETVNERTYNEALEFWASRGFVLPTGALAGRLKEALAEQTRADEQLNYELLIEADKINIDVRKFKASALTQVEQVLVEYIGGVANRAYQAAVAAQEVGIKVYEASVRQYEVLLTKWRTSADVYKTTIEAGLIELEKFKAQMEGARVEASVKQLLVEIYNSQVNVINTYANIYRTEMEGAKIKSDISLNKLAAFREKVNAYTARLNAETIKYDAIKAKIAGESAKAAIYSTQATAYESRVKGITAAIGAKSAEISGYLGEVEAYKAKAEVEKTKVDINVAKAQTFRSKVDAYLGDIEAYKAKGGVEAFKATVASSNAQIAASRADMLKTLNDNAIAKAGFDIEREKLLIESYKARLLKFSEDVKTKIAEVQARLGVYNAKVNMYMGDIREANIANEALIKEAEVAIRADVSAADIALKEADIELNTYLKYQEIRQDNVKAGASVAANLAASAMNAINTTAGMGFDASLSSSSNVSESVSESHSYKEKEICCESGEIIP